MVHLLVLALLHIYIQQLHIKNLQPQLAKANWDDTAEEDS
jgi:hypothetical protein